MSRALRSYVASERAAVIRRRRKEKRGGLGYLAACDAPLIGAPDKSRTADEPAAEEVTA